MVALVLLVWVTCATGSEGYSEVTERIRNRIESSGVPPELAVGDELILAGATAALFYERRGYAPAWTAADGPVPAADSLAVAVRSCRLEGLRPSDYHLEAIESTLGGLRAAAAAGDSLDAGAVVDCELLLTDAFLLVASHYLSGRLDPETIDPEWFAARRGADFAAILEDAIAWNAVRGVLAALLPPDPGYARLRDALAEYRAIAAAGGWPVVPRGEALKPGAEGERVGALRGRLSVTGDLVGASPADSAAFDFSVEEAVRGFQRRHGLDPDGVVGAATLSALNVPVEERVRQLIVNLERWRWLPQETGDTHVIVNIADFTLRFTAPGLEPLAMRVIVGRDYRRTPVFSGEIMYLVFNPRWEVPPSIAVKDVLPEARRDPGYFERLGMRVLVGWGADEEEIDPTAVDWSLVDPANFIYRFQQQPGPQNALGRIKFMFPNRFNVYLHDTPSKGLFAKPERAFSSGCIRVEQPIELAERLLAPDPRWDHDAIMSAIDAGEERTVRLPRPIPIHVLYWTAWVDDEGAVNFRRDVYGRDAAVARALAEPPPETPAVSDDGAMPGGGP
jgi:murein L,D-transpeptidase YcbB/YkuD